MPRWAPSTSVNRPAASSRYGPAPSLSTTASVTSTSRRSQVAGSIAATADAAAWPSGRVTPANRTAPSGIPRPQRRLMSPEPIGAAGWATISMPDGLSLSGASLTPPRIGGLVDRRAAADVRGKPTARTAERHAMEGAS